MTYVDSLLQELYIYNDFKVYKFYNILNNQKNLKNNYI